jgi:hypothetical protein
MKKQSRDRRVRERWYNRLEKRLVPFLLEDVTWGSPEFQDYAMLHLHKGDVKEWLLSLIAK